MIWLITLAAIWLILAAVNECYNLQVANSGLLIVQQLLFTSLEAGLLYLLAVFGTREDLVRLVHAKKADEVILAITGRLHDDLFRGLMACYEQGVDIKPMPLFYEEVLGRVPVEHLGQHWFVGRFHANPPTPYRTLKRFMDIMLALVGLSVLVVIFPFVAAAIYLDSPGPIFYLQERLGRAGRSFRVIKFRSMVPNAERRGQASARCCKISPGSRSSRRPTTAARRCG